MRFIFSLLFILGFSKLSYGITKVNVAQLDTVAMHAVYLDGDFDKATQVLEGALKQKNLQHGDSVFIFKHLGVMYAAREETREKGKYFMYKLITAEPLTNILDMYASDMIYMIFKNIKDEFEANRTRLERAELHMGKAGKGNGSTVSPDDSTDSSRNNKDKFKKQQLKSHSAYFWIGGAGIAAAMVSVGYLVYIHVAEKPSPSKIIYGLD